MRSLLPRALIGVASYLVVVIGLQAAFLWYGRSIYGPENGHPASVSEALGYLLEPLLAAAIAGLVALALVALYWLAAFLWPRRLRRRGSETTALKVGLAVVLAATYPLYVVATSID